MKLSGKILESKIDIPVTPEQPDDGTGEGDIDDGEDENKPSEGGTDDGSGDSSGEDSDKPSNGDGEQNHQQKMVVINQMREKEFQIMV